MMLANASSAAPLVQMGVGEPGLLTLSTRPAILLRKRSSCDAALPGVAPGLAWLGVMLPYTPVQFLLFHEAAKRPAGMGWLERAQDLALVMTSANPGGEPLVVGNSEALPCGTRPTRQPPGAGAGRRRSRHRWGGLGWRVVAR
ncbi:MAG: Sua5/YciO/YrdC/YwlC family protein [Candidatus Accumulibacter sp.]|uniref:Sua5/YciO/YrdC/YwlC family protein n=1 Tax=Candidatus Accumulibacter affinis TaxID=2954384 RepID=A0A935W4M3_9PROT|nr:Sua5/YciO/YrdC/YwlC family protein [Candidatus Accumulibacter affinis]